MELMGGFLYVINALPVLLSVEHQNSHQMNLWNFSDIQTQTIGTYAVQYTSSGNATVQYRFTGLNDTIQLFEIQWVSGTGIRVNWMNIDRTRYCLFPPLSVDSPVADVGWVDGGIVSILIMDKYTITAVKTITPTASSVIEEYNRYPVNIHLSVDIGKGWMYQYQDILQNLTLFDLSIPGTHDAGTYKAEDPLATSWVQTQDISLLQQLQLGIRALDLRIGQESPGYYQIVHDKYKTKYTLTEALEEVISFINETEKEIVILDFHRFVNLGKEDYNFTLLKEQVKKILGDYSIAPTYANKTLRDIWTGSSKRRVVVAWNSDTIDTSYMWRGVNQHWYSEADSKEKLYSNLTRDFTTQQPSKILWAACTFMKETVLNTPKSIAMSLNPTISRWYYGGSTWCLHANILSVDYFESYTNIVQATIVSNLIKAGAKPNSFMKGTHFSVL